MLCHMSGLINNYVQNVNLKFIHWPIHIPTFLRTSKQNLVFYVGEGGGGQKLHPCVNRAKNTPHV